MKIRTSTEDPKEYYLKPSYPYIGKWTPPYKTLDNLFVLFYKENCGMIISCDCAGRYVGEWDDNFAEYNFVPYYGEITIQGDYDEN